MSFLSSLFSGRKAPSSPPFEEWAATVTRPDVHRLFSEVLNEGDADDGIGEPVSSEELEHFDANISAITRSNLPSTTHAIPVHDVVLRLSSLAPRHKGVIEATSDLLTRLLQTHASFPFPADLTQVDLLPEDLLRAILILSSNCVRLFRTAGWAGTAVTISKRPPERRIAWIFASLSEPLGSPSLDDVVDVLCRVPYPRFFDKKSGDLQRKTIEHITPVAERLLYQDDNSEAKQQNSGRISVATQDALSDLVAALNETDKIKLSGDDGVVTQEEFEDWALKVDLLGALNNLFSQLLQKE